MSQPNGLPAQAIGNDTITTHSWSDVTKWSSPTESKYEITPKNGQAMVLSCVLIRFTEGMIVPSNNAHVLEYVLDGWQYSPYKITEYASLNALFSRADEINRVEYAGVGGDISKPIISLKYDFSIPIVLWSSAAVVGGNPKVDAQGKPRFKTLRVRLANNDPYKDTDGNPVEMACSRYFATIYADPYYGV
jgi:hypothetical protein